MSASKTRDYHIKPRVTSQWSHVLYRPLWYMRCPACRAAVVCTTFRAAQEVTSHRQRTPNRGRTCAPVNRIYRLIDRIIYENREAIDRLAKL